MSMYRQLWLAVIISLCLGLVGSLVASSFSARGYLTEQLTMKNADNATALALALSQKSLDAAEVELAAAALFDSGHYELIRVTDPFGKVIIERQAPVESDSAPAWFVRLLPIKAKPGQAQITSGWKQFGTITLVSQSKFAYRALWKNVWELISTLLFAFFISGYLGTLTIRRLHKPLRAVINQAKAITERRFITIDEPNVPELSQLAAAMNATVVRLKTMFEDEASRLEAVRQDANCDPLTGLANRTHFLARLHEALGAEDSRGFSLILIRLADLASINQRLGEKATDDLLRCFATAIGHSAGQWVDGLGSRLRGADFALLLPGHTDARATAERLMQTLIAEAETFVGDGATAAIGFGVFPRGLDLNSVMLQVETALAAAELAGNNAIHEATYAHGEDAPKSAEEWSQLIRQALDKRWVRLVSFPVVDFSGRLIHRECPLRLMLDEHGEWLPAGRFLPMVERLQLTPQIDLAAIKLGLEELAEKPNLIGLAINLSASSIESETFRTELRNLLRLHPETTKRLWLEVGETGALKHLEAFRELCQDIREFGCHLGLEHFGRQFSQIGLLHDLGLDYIKVDASFVRELEANKGNQAFLKGLRSIANGIGLKVIAEGVTTEGELQALKAVGFDGATGPAIKEPIE